MCRWLLLFLIAGFVIFLNSCTSSPYNWTEMIPERTPFVIIPEENSSLNEILNAAYMPLFDDISASAIQVTSELSSYSETDIPILAILLYPDTSNDWQPVWVTESISGFVENLTRRFQRPFTQNLYNFKGYTIQKLFISNRTLFTIDLGSFTLVSESSRAIEDMIRSYHGEIDRLALTEEQVQPGSFVMNTPNLERWVEQMAQISYRPMLLNSFAGSGPFSARLAENNPDGSLLWKLQGTMEPEDEKSALIRGISGPASEMQLDRFISANTSAFSIFRMEPRMVPPSDNEPVSELDQYLAQSSDTFREIASTLNDEVAFVTFAESGFMSSSEFLFLRGLGEPAELRRILNNLVSEDLIQALDDNYIVHSPWLGKLFGSDLSTVSNFYLAIHGNTLAISRSNGIVESVGTDHDSRRVVFYDDHYIDIRENLPERISSFTYVDGPAFNNYIQPWLYPQNYFGALSSSIEILTITTSRENENTDLDIEIASYARERTEAPFRERWVYPLGSDMTGTPVLANIGGSTRDEIVFATTNGTVYAIAADGTIVTQASTSADMPVGSPVVYDWYGNNQNVIMQAAGNKIYAWNETGSVLPNFPVELSEDITTPLQVADITRNGVAEMIVATADRNIHILNSRGDNISGWPQTANSLIRSKPLITEMNQQRSVFAFAENALHGWHINGSRRDGFPVFIESQYNGSPVIHDNHILGAASDGNLYATGTGAVFADSLAASVTGDSLITKSLNISNSSLNRSPLVFNEMIRVDEVLVREDLILTQSSNGSILIVNTDGQLRFTQSMGQPGSDDVSPVILDINNNNRKEVVSLAGSGRLFAWDLISGQRVHDLPTSGMQHPIYYDMNRDGNMEIIAQTREGLRVWTVFRNQLQPVSQSN